MNAMREEDIIGLVKKLYAKTLGPQVICGIGDDTAVLENLAAGYQRLITTDTILMDTHFLAGTPAAAVARKAVNVNVSDIAAMGGEVEAMVVSLTVSNHTAKQYLEELIEQLAKSARKYNISIVGGDTVGGSILSISITMLGKVASGQACYRSNAQVGDLVIVTGKLGGSFVSGRHLSFEPRLFEAQWLVAHLAVDTMMDLSDGLAKDGNRMAQASAVKLMIDSTQLPLNQGCSIKDALLDGEDFELLFTCRPRAFDLSKIKAFKQAFNLELTIIGQVAIGEAGLFIDQKRITETGYDLFYILG